MSVTVYTTDTCATCNMVKKFLKLKSVDFEEVDVSQHPDRQQEAFQLSGSLTVPVILVKRDNGDQNVIVGYNLAQLAPALV